MNETNMNTPQENQPALAKEVISWAGQLAAPAPQPLRYALVS